MTRQPFVLSRFHPAPSSQGSGHFNPVYHNNTACHVLNVMRYSGGGVGTLTGKKKLEGWTSTSEGMRVNFGGLP